MAASSSIQVLESSRSISSSRSSASNNSDSNVSNANHSTTRTRSNASGAGGASKWDKTKTIMSKYGSFIGPGLLVSVAYMDPGNYATGITAGASNEYSLLFFVFISNIIAIFLQAMCIKLGSVSGYDLARCCREFLPRWMNLTVWVLAESAIVATDVAEVIGSAIALNILIKVPLPAGVVITVVDVLFVLMAYRNDTSSTKFVKYFEYAVAAMVMAVVICFAVELSHIHANARDIFRGFVPSKQMFQKGGMTIATSIIGSTVMIHSLFLGSGLVQPRLREYDVNHGIVNLLEVVDTEIYDEKLDDKQRAQLQYEREAIYFYKEYKPSYEAVKYSYNYSLIELAVTLVTVALFVNAAILIVAGSTLYGTEEAVDADLYTIHSLLSKTLAPIVGTVFMLALLFSGQSAGIVCTIAGQIVSEGHINWTVKPWIRRLITRSISIVPALVISVCIGRNGLNAALNISQVVISILLPPLTAPLIYFTSKKSIMRLELPEHMQVREDGSPIEVGSEDRKYKYMANSWLTMIVATIIWVFISALNIYAIYEMAKDGIN